MKPTTGEDVKGALRSKLTSLAHDYTGIKQDRFTIPLGKEHLVAIRQLCNMKDGIVITRPNKGAGTVLLDR